MPQTPHIEHHFTAGDTVRDIVIGMSDGLTVPLDPDDVKVSVAQLEYGLARRPRKSLFTITARKL